MQVAINAKYRGYYQNDVNPVIIPTIIGVNFSQIIIVAVYIKDIHYSKLRIICFWVNPLIIKRIDLSHFYCSRINVRKLID